MKFLYKIHSRYDGFRPQRIPERAVEGRFLDLGWRRYFDEVEEEDEIWVYFHGGSFQPGVYAKGVAVGGDARREIVRMLIHDYSTDQPLTDAATSAEIAEIVATRYRQVFFVPDGWKTVANCSLSTTADSCSKRRCQDCGSWKRLRQVDPKLLRRPWRMRDDTVAAYVPAYWAIPPRSFLYYDGRPIDPEILRTSGLFRRFKVGDANLAYPFALGIVQQLRRSRMTEVDVVVPIPLSPEKAARKELHRAKALADEVGRLLSAPVRDLLTLHGPIGKRAMRQATGAGPEEFEAAYREQLIADSKAAEFGRILIVDDVCTEGSTLECAAEAILQIHPGATVLTATAAQMAVRGVVGADVSPLFKHDS